MMRRMATNVGWIPLLLLTGPLAPAQICLQPPQAVGAGREVVSGDFDEDGILDLVTVSDDTAGGTSILTLWLGNGSGSFVVESVESFAGSGSVDWLHVADSDDDGHVDLLGASDYGSELFVMRGQGAEGLQSPEIHLLDCVPANGLLVADFDADGIPDVVAFEFLGNRGACLHPGDRMGGFEEAVFLDGYIGSRGLPGDFNEDGHLDFVARDGFFEFPLPGGDPPPAWPPGWEPPIGGFLGEGGNIDLFLGDGEGGFERVTAIEETVASPRIATDLDADGHLDLVVDQHGSPSRVLFGDGGGGFGNAVDLPAGGATLLANDLNEDGMIDLVLSDGEEPGFVVLLGDDSATFEEFVTWPMEARVFDGVAGDFDGSGRLDLALASWDFDLDFQEVTVHRDCAIQFQRGDCDGNSALGIGDPIFQLAFLFSGGDTPPCGDACDVNDDGVAALEDAIGLLGTLFAGGPDPAPPFPGCGEDPTPDALDCAVPTYCP